MGNGLKVLMVWPRVPESFWSFEGAIRLIRRDAVMPPLGLITLAALCPETWTVRLIDQAFEELRDEDLLWADLVMVSGMYVQRDGVLDALARARRLGRRTLFGGPLASSQPKTYLEFADHVVVGEPDEVFAGIAEDLELGRALRLYEIEEKPDVSRTPVPRFDLLKIEHYASMPLQFSRGCPFQCEFCDIIAIYGRRPRTKTPAQFTAELDALYARGWKKEVFIVDDNFVGNRKKALELVQELRPWQEAHGRPFTFYTEASVDLAQQQQLVEAMVEANFFYVFIGIESPSTESLKETKKYQNLREDPLKAIRHLQSQGLWVTGGFIIGFDSDREDIFDRQIDFISRAAIPWAMIGFLQAPPKTALFDRLMEQDRLDLESQATSNFSLPNFQTRLPLDVLLTGFRRVLSTIYEAESFYDRAFRSLWHWKIRACQRPPYFSPPQKLLIAWRSVWEQGVLSSDRKAYWKFFVRLLYYWGNSPAKLWLGFTVLLSANHFIPFADRIGRQLEAEMLEMRARAD